MTYPHFCTLSDDITLRLFEHASNAVYKLKVGIILEEKAITVTV